MGCCWPGRQHCEAYAFHLLLQVNPDLRLGVGSIHEIKNHAWFASMDWSALDARKIRAPIIPELKSINDMSNFANYDSEMTPPPVNTRNDRSLWQMWQWVDTKSLRIHDVFADSS
jgi:hypothetical protein